MYWPWLPCQLLEGLRRLQGNLHIRAGCRRWLEFLAFLQRRLQWWLLLSLHICPPHMCTLLLLCKLQHGALLTGCNDR
jgi:hypothetical protein